MQSIDELLEIYLIKYKRCPVLHIGTLALEDTPASASLAERVIYPPGQTVKLLPDITDTTDLLEFVANRQEVTSEKVLQDLSSFSKELKLLMGNEVRKMPSIGNFYVTPDGYLDFTCAESAFLPAKPVRAEWVIHADATHQIRVGDKETNSTEMTTFLSERDKISKSWWWIAALFLALTSAGLIGFYYVNPHPSNSGGNEQPINIKPTTTTYATD